MSKLSVNTIGHSGGTSALTIASNGSITPSNTSQSAQTFSLQANVAGSGSAGTIISNLLEASNDYTRVGSVNWSQSSGVFSSATTGTFFCSWQVVVEVAVAGDNFDPQINISTNSGSSYSGRSYAWGYGATGGKITVSSSFIFTVNNASTFRLRFNQSTTNEISTNTTIVGNTGYVATGLTFIKLGVV